MINEGYSIFECDDHTDSGKRVKLYSKENTLLHEFRVPNAYEWPDIESDPVLKEIKAQFEFNKGFVVHQDVKVYNLYLAFVFKTLKEFPVIFIDDEDWRSIPTYIIFNAYKAGYKGGVKYFESIYTVPLETILNSKSDYVKIIIGKYHDHRTEHYRQYSEKEIATGNYESFAGSDGWSIVKRISKNLPYILSEQIIEWGVLAGLTNSVEVLADTYPLDELKRLVKRNEKPNLILIQGDKVDKRDKQSKGAAKQKADAFEEIKDLKLVDLFNSISQYNHIAKLLVENNFLSEFTYKWVYKEQGGKSIIGALIYALFTKGYLKRSYSEKEQVQIIKNTFEIEMTERLLQNFEKIIELSRKHFNFIKPASAIK